MPQNNCDPTDSFINPMLGNDNCPKCGAEMEPIASTVKELPLSQLRLCPECYLVTWKDASGFQIRQGVPMKSPDWGMGKPN